MAIYVFQGICTHISRAGKTALFPQGLKKAPDSTTTTFFRRPLRRPSGIARSASVQAVLCASASALRGGHFIHCPAHLCQISARETPGSAQAHGHRTERSTRIRSKISRFEKFQFGGDNLCFRFFVRVQTFCVATLTPRGDPLSASLRALVGEGWEGYDPQRASNSNSSSPKRLPGAEGPPEGIHIQIQRKGSRRGHLPARAISEASREARCLF